MTLAEVTVPGWAAWAAGITATCTTILALAGVWSKVVRPLVAFGATLDAYFPVMVQIAKNYTDDRGGEALTAELAGLAVNQGSIAENQALLVSKIEDVQNTLNELHNYTHTMKHDIIGNVAQMSVAFGTTVTIVDALITVAQRLDEVRTALNGEEQT